MKKQKIPPKIPKTKQNINNKKNQQKREEVSCGCQRHLNPVALVSKAVTTASQLKCTIHRSLSSRKGVVVAVSVAVLFPRKIRCAKWCCHHLLYSTVFTCRDFLCSFAHDAIICRWTPLSARYTCCTSQSSTSGICNYTATPWCTGVCCTLFHNTSCHTHQHWEMYGCRVVPGYQRSLWKHLPHSSWVTFQYTLNPFPWVSDNS